MKAMYNIKGKEVETKNFPFQLKSINEDEGTVTGHLSTFGNVDLQKDRVLPGAFKKTLADGYRRKQNGRKFLMPDLWMHDPNQPTGGTIEAQEDIEGLLVTMQYDITVNAAGFPNNPIATMVFSGHKMGYIDELSMGYVAIQKEFDGGVRNLKEVQLIECSAVTMLFAANPEALVPASGVKSMLKYKTVCGDTSLPIGPRKDTWDGAAAKKQIFNYAKDGDSFDVSKLKKCFLQQDGDAQQKGSWNYPYVEIVDGSPQINVAGVIACANALNGARNADAGEDTDGMRKKVATMYGRINKKYSDDDQLEPPWEDGKMHTQPAQQKTLMEHYNEEMAQDLLEDWQDVYVCCLTKAIFDSFTIGDQPASDISEALDSFKELVLSKFVAQAVECNLSQYISDSGYSYNPASTTLQNGSSDYGWMSRSDPLQGRKAGRAISAANQSILEQHQEGIKAHLDAMQTEMKGMQQKVSDLTRLWQDEGQGDAYSNDKSRVPRREPPQTLMTRNVQPLHKSTVDDTTVAELEALLS
jgi:HK97 family phage prohead protease